MMTTTCSAVVVNSPRRPVRTREAAVVDAAGMVWAHSNPAALYRWITRSVPGGRIKRNRPFGNSRAGTSTILRAGFADFAVFDPTTRGGRISGAARIGSG